MSKRFIAAVLVAVVATATFLIASPAHAETCLPLPPTTGATLEVAGREIRIPATSGVAVCVEPGGLPGTPRIDSSSQAISLVVSGGSNTAGYVVVRYSIDGAPTQHLVPIPGTGPGTETCIASVGEAPRDDCLLFELEIDDMPTVPPTPTTGPLPTVPPVPTLPPTPEPDPFCPTRTACVPYGGSTLQEPFDGLVAFVRDTLKNLDDEINEFLFGPCGVLNPHSTC